MKKQKKKKKSFSKTEYMRALLCSESKVYNIKVERCPRSLIPETAKKKNQQSVL